ncbi:hypothetical protein E2H02_16675 [Salmonella enterica subsp. enterica serovar Reading]|nr:hypothetical protein [Salmonella enterica subsp. enterica serovar Reading]
MKKIKILFLLLLAGGGLSHASVQKTLFSADVVASACHVVVDADGTGSSRLTFGTYRKSSAAPVPPRDFTVRLYETGATVQGCSAFLAGQIATLNFGNPGQLDGQGVVTRGAGDGIRIDVRAADTQADFGGLPQSAEGVFDSGDAYSFARTLFPGIAETWSDNGTAYAPGNVGQFDFSSTANTYHAYYASGIPQDANLSITLDQPAASDAIKWHVSLPITVSYN